jgi:hypothetical protein
VKPRSSRSAAFALAATVLTGAWAGGCGGGESSNLGQTEPLEVIGGQFFAGDLPGKPPTAAVPQGDGGAPASLPPLSIPVLSVPVLPLPYGASNEVVSGYTTSDAASVALRFPDEGTGYWVVPVGGVDSNFPGELTFKFNVNFNPNDRTGPRKLRAVAIDGAGHAGTQAEGTICIQPRVPDGGHTCNPAKDPPATVIALQWDTTFDLDLHVFTPDGQDINPKRGIGEPFDGGYPIPPDAPRIDRDSMRACFDDGYLEEDLIFPTPPAKGNYYIYVDPFAPCGQQSTRFTLTIYESKGTCPACTQVSTFSIGGELLASQVTGGQARGLFVHTYSVH